MALRDLAANETNPLEGFNLFGVIKETGVDDEGLAEFAQYYPFPLYRDENLEFYSALGNRKLKLTTWNPWKLWKGYLEVSKRVKEKKLENNMKGEGLVQGGIIIFGKDGMPRYSYLEETGNEIPIDDLMAAINAVREEK